VTLDGKTSGRYGIPRMIVRTPLVAPGQRIGLLGGSFNPAHEGHLLISRIAHRQLGLDQVWWLVSPGNPLKSHDDLPSVADRISTAHALGLPPWLKLTAFEEDLGTSYTAATLRFLTQRYRDVDFVWIMGADNLATFHRWHDWRGIAETLPLVIANRPGHRFRAVAGPAARTLEARRVAEARIRGLPARKAPAWGFIQGPLSTTSSTDIRRKTHDFTKT
jgi:nicotinate-nucleotide adenylyltransferase